MSKFNFDKQLKALEGTKSSLPVKLGNATQRFFLSSFKEEGWNDGGLNRWPDRKDDTNTRSLLVKSGRLRKAVADCLREANWNRIKFVVDVPYAQIHNEGGYAGRNHAAKIPKRQFIGDSATLRKIQTDLIIQEFNKIFHGR